MSSGNGISARPFHRLTRDRWAATTRVFVEKMVSTDTVSFSNLVDATALIDLRHRYALLDQPRPSYTAMVIKALALALRAHPALNRLMLAGIYRDRPVQLNEVHITVAVERVLDGESVVHAAILRHADEKSVSEITAELQRFTTVEPAEDPGLRALLRLVKRVPGPLSRLVLRLPYLSPSLWLQHNGGACALTTVGKYGVDAVAVKWPYPLTFTFGEVKPRALVRDGHLVARPSFHASLTWQRLLTHGAPAARFFADIVEHLTNADLGGDNLLQSSQRHVAAPADARSDSSERIGCSGSVDTPISRLAPPTAASSTMGRHEVPALSAKELR